MDYANGLFLITMREKELLIQHRKPPPLFRSKDYIDEPAWLLFLTRQCFFPIFLTAFIFQEGKKCTEAFSCDEQFVDERE